MWVPQSPASMVTLDAGVIILALLLTLVKGWWMENV